MSDFGWQGSRSVEAWLFAQGYRFDFYQAVRLLEMLQPDRTPVGEGPDARREPVRFHSRVSFEFPPSEIHELTPAPEPESAAEAAAPPDMTVNFLGLAGALGPLPTSFTEQILERARSRDTGMRDFLDLFNHRLVSLLYRIRKVHRLQLNNLPPEETNVAGWLRAILGIGLEPLRTILEDPSRGLPPRELLGYAGLISRRPTSAEVLRQMLSHHFNVPLRVRQFVGAWRPLAADQQTRLGVSGGANQLLGVNAVAGTRVWDQQGRFRVEIGPTSLPRLREFLPIGPNYRPLREMAEFYSGGNLDFTLRLRLHPAEVPEARLGTARLGWTSWLKSAPFAREGVIDLAPQSGPPPEPGAQARAAAQP